MCFWQHTSSALCTIAAQLHEDAVANLDTWMCNALQCKEWEAGNHLVAAVVAVRMSAKDVKTLSRYDISFDRLVNSYGVLFEALSDVARESSRQTCQTLDTRNGVNSVKILFEYCVQWSPWSR